MSAPYRIPAGPGLELAVAVLLKQRRSFKSDAQAFISQLKPLLQLEGEAYLPQHGPCLLAVNHYRRPGLQAWWLALAISALLPLEVQWIITEAWVSPRQWQAAWLTPLTRFIFRRVARVYGFINMPPMPPRAGEEVRRARAVREALRRARAGAVIGLAPEGRDAPGGVLGTPPPGVGRFLLLLAGAGMMIVPVGVFEDTALATQEFSLWVRFGPPFTLQAPAGLSADERDGWAALRTMQAIARLLPERLRGAYQ